MTVRLAVWSGPRNVSTALMYAFAQRRDTLVVDEPLYAAYLARGEGADHPGRDAVLAAQDADARRVIDEVLLGPCPTPVLMAKHMAHHLRGLEAATDGWAFLDAFTNVLLTREPMAMLASLARTLPRPTLDDTGLPEQVAILRRVLATGARPAVVTAEQILADPRRALSALCTAAGIEFDEGMLTWEPGPKPYDGVWAPHWYAGVHRTTGFLAPPAREPRLPPDLAPLLEACAPLHAELAAHPLIT